MRHGVGEKAQFATGFSNILDEHWRGKLKLFTKVLVALAVLGAGAAVGAVLMNGVPVFDPPGWKTRLLIYFSKNSAETDPDSPLPELRPRVYPLSPQQLFKLARASAIELDWQIKSVDASQFRLELVVTTALLGFRDDVVVHARPTSGDESSLYVHSKSRVGRADFGANLGHILRLKKTIQEKIAAK